MMLFYTCIVYHKISLLYPIRFCNLSVLCFPGTGISGPKRNFGTSSYGCCLIPSMTKEEYINHSAEVHNTNYHSFCDLCCKGFVTYSGFYRHQKMHLGEKGGCQTCSICGKQFPSLSNFKRHMLVHSDFNAFNCDKCGKSYKSEYYFKHKCYQ